VEVRAEAEEAVDDSHGGCEELIERGVTKIPIKEEGGEGRIRKGWQQLPVAVVVVVMTVEHYHHHHNYHHHHHHHHYYYY